MNQQDLFASAKPLKLVVRGNVPSFKNSKMLIAKSPQGIPLARPLMITKPELQQRMAEITESFVLQLLSLCQTEGGKTLTGCALQSSIALSVPDDDCWTRIPELPLTARLTEPGECEGALITITPL